MGNPWEKLSPLPPYVLPRDSEVLDGAPNSIKSNLVFDVLPDPYFGDPTLANVFLLALNPGFLPIDRDVHMKDTFFIEQNKLNLIHSSIHPWYFFEERLHYTGGYKWWSRILAPLFRDCDGERIMNKLMCVEYLPYHSIKYKHLPQLLPSQEYSLELVRQAMKANKLIIIMRSKKLWLEALPELASYPFIQLKNPRTPSISPGNMQKEDYLRLLKYLSNAPQNEY